MTEKEFSEKYCKGCSSLVCTGTEEEAAKGCKDYQKEVLLFNGIMKQAVRNGNGYAVITMVSYRENSNLYKDSYNQETFDFNKLIGGD